jgi:hypothetical protein
MFQDFQGVFHPPEVYVIRFSWIYRIIVLSIEVNRERD